MKTTHEDLARRIRKARHGKGWTQFELSRRVGCSESQIAKIETGRVVPDATLANAIFRELGDARFQQLCALADEGNAEAVADLFREFNFRFGEDEP